MALRQLAGPNDGRPSASTRAAKVGRPSPGAASDSSVVAAPEAERRLVQLAVYGNVDWLRLASTMCEATEAAVDEASDASRRASELTEIARAELAHSTASLEEQSASRVQAFFTFKSAAASASDSDQATFVAANYLQGEEERKRSERESEAMVQQKRLRFDDASKRETKFLGVEQIQRALNAKSNECVELARQLHEAQRLATEAPLPTPPSQR